MMTIEELVKEIHKSDAYGTIWEMGAGQPVASELFNVAGASKTVAMAASPYGREIQETMFGGNLPRSVSAEFVRIPLLQCTDENFTYASSFQINPEGMTHGWIGIRYKEKVNYFHMTIGGPKFQEKYTYIREESINTIGSVGIEVIAYMLGITSELNEAWIDIVLDENLRIDLEKTWNASTHSMSACVISKNGYMRAEELLRLSDIEQLTIFKGSFNPIHPVHEWMMKEVNTPLKCFAICKEAVGKDDVKFEDLKDRINAIFEKFPGAYIMLGGYSLFQNFLEDLHDRHYLKHVKVLMGWDTFKRVEDELYDNFKSVEFVVFDRDGEIDENKKRDNISFKRIPKDLYGISSTKIREQCQK